MLHAELHNKLSSQALEHERNEDVLTSTVFGVLLSAEGGQQVLREWLRKARFAEVPTPFQITGGNASYTFWPRLENCVPDLALGYQDQACVIEAKFLSGASDIDGDGAEQQLQLAREWKACVSGVKLAAVFDRSAHFANAFLLYMVDGIRGVRASRLAVEKARAQCSASRIGLLFWQDLHTGLISHPEFTNDRHRWMRDLAWLLRRRQLGTFSGFAGRFVAVAARGSRRGT